MSDKTEVEHKATTTPQGDVVARTAGSCRVISESPVDYKYERIVEHLPIEYRCRGFTRIIGDLLRGGECLPDVFHIRYLKWRGYLATAVRYALLVSLCKLRGVRIVFSCHNVRSYSIPSERYDTVLRRALCRAADSIVVFDEALCPYLETWSDKVVVASFGEFRSLYSSAVDARADEGFIRRYRHWSAALDPEAPRLLFVGAYAPSKNVEKLLEIGRRNANLSVVVVAPGMEEVPPVSGNVLLHTNWVGEELEDILSEPNLLGFVGHANISVPTAIYLFASYGVPLIALDQPPLNRIVETHELGAVIDTTENIGEIARRVLAHAEHYRDALHGFLRSHSWTASAAAHRKAFGIR